MKRLITMTTLVSLSLSLQACSSHKREIFISGIVGAAAGAGLGYGVVHHGKDRKYEVQNTIITSAVVGLLTMGVMSWHYSSLDQQKVDIMSGLTREWVKNPENQNTVMQLGNPSLTTASPSMIGTESLKLDDNTRWVFPTFRERDLRPEIDSDQITSSRKMWEIVRPGFFVNREVQPWYFDSERENSGKASIEKTDAAVPARKKNALKKESER